MTRSIRSMFGGRLAALAALASLGMGCAAYSPHAFQEVAETKAEIEAGNFRVVRTGLSAEASTDYLGAFELGGRLRGIPLGDTALLERAMRSFHEKYGEDLIGRSVYLSNLTHEWTTERYFFVYARRSVTLTADVVEFTDEYRDYRRR